MTKQFLTVLVLVMATVACVKVKSKEKSEDKQELPPQTEKVPEGELLQIRPLAEPNNYLVILRAISGASGLYRSQQLQDGTWSPATVVPLNLTGGYITEKGLIAGQTYRYQWVKNEGKDTEVIQDFNATIPLDLVVRGTTEIKENTVWNQHARVFLLDRAKIRIHSYKFVVEAREIISQQARIETFEPQTQAAFMKEGRNGGEVILKADVGQGVLELVMRGENGGNGSDGGSTPGSDGRKGGNTGGGRVQISQNNQLCVVVHQYPGTGGTGGKGGLSSVTRHELPPGKKGPEGEIDFLTIQNPMNCPSYL